MTITLHHMLTVFFGGILGAVLMDITETLAAKRGIYSGVTVALVGRWAVALMQGHLLHRDIRQTAPYRHERAAGWLFHFIIGGGAVSLLFPLLWGVMSGTGLPSSPLPYLLFGLATSALPWFILLPSFGWGWWGRQGPTGSNALLASTLSHIPYGLGIWLAVALSG